MGRLGKYSGFQFITCYGSQLSLVTGGKLAMLRRGIVFHGFWAFAPDFLSFAMSSAGLPVSVRGIDTDMQ